MLSELKSTITQTTADLYGQQTEVEVDRPEERFGDYSTNVSLKLAKVLSRSPQEIAEELADKLRSNSLFSDVSVAGAGFINFKLANQALVELAESQPSKSLEGKTVVAEYSDPNPFKVLHAGHVYGSVVGDAIANLLVSAGAKVHRVNFGGDVGRHVAISMWSILGKLDGENPDKLTEVNEADRLQWLTDRYVEGYAAFESDEAVKSSVTELNKRIYKIVNSGDHDSALAKIYWTCRQWSYDSLKQFYEKIGITFERYYPESEVSELGFQTVRQHTPDVYTESDGAIVFKGEDYGLFTNVFINSQGLPTYAAKD
ncbi:MAG TPA: arginine--tRNA ligase, partial [Candidatus Saccharimonadales bacterium]